jgi:glycosyltransferase involved in cell wall biosynthesis
MSKISIITPFRNAESYIHETAESIFNQNYTNWEWILINDHSLENEKNILFPYLKDERIRIIQNKGKGITNALIAGLEVATGEFITRMDADDIMPEFKIRLFYEQLLEQKIDIVTGKVKYFCQEGIVSRGYQKYENWLNTRVDNQDFYQDIYRECSVASGNWMMRTELFKKCGGFEGLSYPEDYDLLFRWYENNLKIFGINDVTHLWREHPLRTSKTSKDYDQKSFFSLKINRFLKFDYHDKVLILNGTGTKGKLTAKILINNNIEFQWVSVEPEKFRSGIYGKMIVGVEDIKTFNDLLILNVTTLEKKAVLNLYLKNNTVLDVFTL